MTLKMAVFTPMPRASVTIAMAVKAGPLQQAAYSVANVLQYDFHKPPVRTTCVSGWLAFLLSEPPASAGGFAVSSSHASTFAARLRRRF